MSSPAYKRALLKLSGEALAAGSHEHILDFKFLNYLAEEIAAVCAQGVQLSLVIGGGNIFRGKTDSDGLVLDRTTADHMGMLATVINSLAMQSVLELKNIATRVMSAMPVNPACEAYIRRRAIRHLEKGRVVVLAGGTGNPFFTTDTAASLRAAELGCDVLLKATKVDGVYDSDPATTKNAQRYERLSYDEAIEKGLAVIDTTAFVLCRENKIPLRVFNITESSAMRKIIQGQSVGTLVC